MMTRTEPLGLEEQLLQVAPDAMLVVNSTGRIVQANALAEQLFGYHRDMLLGQPLESLIAERARSRQQHHLAEYFAKPLSYPRGCRLKFQGLRRDGSELAMEISFSPLPTPAGPLVLAAVRNTTEEEPALRTLEPVTTERQEEAGKGEPSQQHSEHQQAMAKHLRSEGALLKTEAFYRRLVENQPDLICRFLPDTSLTFVNAAYARFFGCQANELLGKRFIHFLAVEEQANVYAELAAFTPAAPARQYEHRTQRADGTWRWHLWHDYAFFDEQGKVSEFQSIGVDITERRQAEAALRESEERYRQLFELGSHALFLIDNSTGQILEVNNTASELYGYRREELLRMKNTDLSAEPDATRAATARRQSDVPVRFHRKRDGRVFPVEIMARHFLWQGHEVHLAAIRNITTRLNAQQEIERQRSFLRRVIDADPHFIYVKDRQDRIVLANLSLAQNFGLTPEQLVGQTVFDSIPCREIAQTMFSDDMAILNGGQDRIEREERFIDRAGKVRWAYTVKLPLKDEAGKVEQLIGISIDITELKRAKEALFEEKERAQVTLRCIGDGVITTDASGRIEYLNPVAEALSGWTMAEATGRPLDRVFRLVEEDSRKPVPDPVRQCLGEGKTVKSAAHSMLISRSRQEYAIEHSAAPIRSREERLLGVVLVFRDVTEAHQLVRQMAHDATHDPLTGLVNRREFERRLEHALASTSAYEAQHALCYLDLDQFKLVNDTAGHPAGDELLKQIKGRLAGSFRERDTLARLGGDEFGLLLDNCPLNRAVEIAQAIIKSIRDYRFLWEGRTFQLGASIGLVPITAASESTAQLLSQADVACYTAKELGRNRLHIYRTANCEPAQRHTELRRAAQLRDVLDQERFRLYYQPIVPLSGASTAATCYEILLRLVDDDGELVLPGAFIPAAERYGLMDAIDRWVIRTAFHQYPEGPGTVGAKIAINLSGNSLNDDTLLSFVQAQFKEWAFQPAQLCFEITETAAIQNLRQTTEFMTEIKKQGGQLALDDFGSGSSSLRYLKSLPVDYLKIDGSFVRDMAANSGDSAMVAAINQMAHTMGIQTIAEYAATPAIVEHLRQLGVDYVQGYALGPPRPWSRI